MKYAITFHDGKQPTVVTLDADDGMEALKRAVVWSDLNGYRLTMSNYQVTWCIAPVAQHLVDADFRCLKVVPSPK